MPASTADKQFAAKHPIQVVDPLDDDRAENNDKVFRGSTHEYDRSEHRFGYNAGEDENVYEDEEIDPEYQETLLEISKKVLGNYVKKASHDVQHQGYMSGVNDPMATNHPGIRYSERQDDYIYNKAARAADEKSVKHGQKGQKRATGVVTAFKKVAGLAKVPAKD